MAAKSEGWDKYGKSRNLTAKQKATGARAGGGKIGKPERYMATKATRVNISNTEWKPGVGLVNKGDGSTKITGSVRLPSGEIANYVRGKRIVSNGAGKSKGRTPTPTPKPKPKPTTVRQAPGTLTNQGTPKPKPKRTPNIGRDITPNNPNKNPGYPNGKALWDKAMTTKPKIGATRRGPVQVDMGDKNTVVKRGNTQIYTKNGWVDKAGTVRQAPGTLTNRTKKK